MEKVKKIISALFLLIIITNAGRSQAETYMTTQEAQKKFGAKPFDQQQFKKGDQKLRGEMTADLVLKKAFIGMPLKSVRELLGAPDGYFENKAIPAYLISTKEKDIWQVIFLPDTDWKKVDDVKIHKNCCD
jgi:hypothetical protein